MTQDSQMRSVSNWLQSITVILALGITIVCHIQLMDKQRAQFSRAAEFMYLPKGEYLKIASLGYPQILADLIWLQVVHHFGVRNQTTEGYLWSYHAVDVLTDLDPKFIFAYQAAGTNLAISAKRIRESIAILEKGSRNNPESWILPFLLGYDYYFELHDPKTAGKYFRIASLLPGSPAYLLQFATKMTVEAGDPNLALEFLQRLYQQVSDELIRERLVQRMKEVMAEQDMQVLEEGVRRYKLRYGKLPTKVQDLAEGGILLKIPTDPLGGEYRLNALDGTISSTGLKERLRIYKN